jgi:hypothetical protein
MGNIDIEKLVNEYLTLFYKHYKLPRHFEQETELLEWCKSNLGKEFRDWNFYKGHSTDPYTVLHIKNSKWCVMFELTWSPLIIGTIDILKR